MLFYAFIGLVGLPVFSQFSGGLDSLAMPTFGFILSYIIVAYVVGEIVRKFPTVKGFVIAALVELPSTI